MTTPPDHDRDNCLACLRGDEDQCQAQQDFIAEYEQWYHGKHPDS